MPKHQSRKNFEPNISEAPARSEASTLMQRSHPSPAHPTAMSNKEGGQKKDRNSSAPMSTSPTKASGPPSVPERKLLIQTRQMGTAQYSPKCEFPPDKAARLSPERLTCQAFRTRHLTILKSQTNWLNSGVMENNSFLLHFGMCQTTNTSKCQELSLDTFWVRYSKQRPNFETMSLMLGSIQSST